MRGSWDSLRMGCEFACPCWTIRLPALYIAGIMHEVGITESALTAVLAQARFHGASRIHRVVLRIGALSGVVADSVRFAFEAVSRGTMAEGAVLEIVEEPVEVFCARCQTIFAATGAAILSCPRCGQLSADIRRGRELELSQIEMS